MRAPDLKELVVSAGGNCAIVITAPHGGVRDIPGVAPRRNGEKVRDDSTLELAQALCKSLAESEGLQPYIVAARFHRRYIDANRDDTEAYEQRDAGPIYAEYHSRIRQFVKVIRVKFHGRGLLLDIHGQGVDEKAIYRGTSNRLTVKNLLKTYGEEALSGSNSILGSLEAMGHRVFPPSARMHNASEDSRFRGGYTVRTYGSHQEDGIDAIQLEFGIDLRKDPRFIDQLQRSVITFYRNYLVPRA
jgi:N-formylglutamate amidohydrolase